jgi:hypothetical protein
MPDQKFTFKCADLLHETAQLSRHGEDCAPGNSRYDRAFLIFQALDQLGHMTRSLWRHDTELGQVRPDRIDDHRPLPGQKIACPMQDENTLLLLGLDWDVTHVRAADGLTNCSCIGGIVLLPLNIGLYIGRWDQANVHGRAP